MKSKIFLIGALATILMTVEVSLAATSSLCPGEEGFFFVNYRRRNPTNGGFVSNEAYVDDNDYIFIAPSAAVCGSSKITNNAKIYGSAVIKGATVADNAEVFGEARVQNGAEILEYAKVNESALVRGSVRISGKAIVGGQAIVSNSAQDELAQVYDEARVTGSARVNGNAQVHGKARVMGQAVIGGTADVKGTAVIMGYTKLRNEEISSGTRNDHDFEALALEKRKAELAEAARLRALQDEKDRLEDQRKLRERIKKDKADQYQKLMSTVSEWLETKEIDGYQVFDAGLCRLKISFPTSDKKFTNGDIYFNEELEFKLGSESNFTTIWIENWENSRKGLKSVLWTSNAALQEEPALKADGSRDVKNALGSFTLPLGWKRSQDAQNVIDKFKKIYELCHELK